MLAQTEEAFSYDLEKTETSPSHCDRWLEVPQRLPTPTPSVSQKWKSESRDVTWVPPMVLDPAVPAPRPCSFCFLQHPYLPSVILKAMEALPVTGDSGLTRKQNTCLRDLGNRSAIPKTPRARLHCWD